MTTHARLAVERRAGLRHRLRGARAAGFVLAGALALACTWLIAFAWPAPAVERATLASVLVAPLWSGFALALLLRRRRGQEPRRGRARRRLVGLHRRLGGALVVAAIVVFGSGTGAVLDRALAGWQMQAVAPAGAAPPVAEQALDAAVATVLRQQPALGDGDLLLHPADAIEPWIRVDFHDRARRPVRVYLDPVDGQVRGRGRGPLAVLSELHRRALLPAALGESLLGLLGLGLALVVLAGLATRRWLRPGRRRSSGQRRRPALVMRGHQWLGLGLLPAALLWCWTGALIGLTMLIVPVVGDAAYAGDRRALMQEVLAVDRPPLDGSTIAPPRLRELLDGQLGQACPALTEALADGEIERIWLHHPTRASARIRVDFEAPGLLARGSVTVDGQGRPRDCRSLPTAGVGLRSFMAAIILHEGSWSGGRWLIDLVYVLLGAGLVALAWLGGELLARRRARAGDDDGALRLRRTLTWVSHGLGLVVVGLLLLSRIPELGASETAALRLTAGIVGASGLWSFTGSLASRRLGSLSALALGLIALPLVGWLVGGVRPGIVEGVGLLVAAAVLAEVWRRAGRPAAAQPCKDARMAL